MEKLIILILVIPGLACLGCESGQRKYTFPTTNTISDPEGNPADSTIQFLPTELVFNDATLIVEPKSWYTPNFHRPDLIKVELLEWTHANAARNAQCRFCNA